MKVEIKLDKNSGYILNSVANAEREIEKARERRENAAVLGGFLAFLAPVFPPLAIPASLAVAVAHDYNLDVQDGPLTIPQSRSIYSLSLRKAYFGNPTQLSR